MSRWRSPVARRRVGGEVIAHRVGGVVFGSVVSVDMSAVTYPTPITLTTRERVYVLSDVW